MQQKDLGCCRSYALIKAQNKVLFQSQWVEELLGSLGRSCENLLMVTLNWNITRESGYWITIYSSYWSAEIYIL